MTDQSTQNGGSSLAGQMFLYQNPELLMTETHGEMGLSPVVRPFDFVRNVRAIPLTMIEFSAAQRSYPIIFSNLDKPMPLAVVGLQDDVNLFVDDRGQWDRYSYIPNYLRCYPFTFAREASGGLAVVVDRDAPSVSETPVYPFFVDGEPSEHTNALTQMCIDYEKERQRTVDYCRKLVDLGVLAVMRSAQVSAANEDDETPVADYVAIDAKKLDELPADTVHELHRSGFLSASYLHLYSLENWRTLLTRREDRNEASATA